VRLALLLGPALAAILVQDSRAAGQAGALAGGAEVAQRFCYACHDREETRGNNPLLPRLDERRFGTPAEAYTSIGRLDQLNGAMTLPFNGTDEERRALAAWLAAAAQRSAHAHAAQERWAVVLAVAATVTAVTMFAIRRGRGQRRPGA